MKITLHYSTFMTLYVYACGMTVTIDMECKPLDEILDFVQSIFDDKTFFHGDSVEQVCVIDSKTGELIAECVPDKEVNNDAESWPTPEEIFDEKYDDWAYNEDMGFDAYLGDYTYDC